MFRPPASSEGCPAGSEMRRSCAYKRRPLCLVAGLLGRTNLRCVRARSANSRPGVFGDPSGADFGVKVGDLSDPS